jgi:hypothetical protein
VHHEQRTPCAHRGVKQPSTVDASLHDTGVGRLGMRVDTRKHVQVLPRWRNGDLDRRECTCTKENATPIQHKRYYSLLSASRDQ